MQGADFYKYLDKFPTFKKHFKGIYSIDTLPKTLNYRNFLIANTDLQKGFGIHWIGFCRSSKNNIELFDSLSLTSEKQELIVKYCKFKQEILFNETEFQLKDTTTCGLFVIYYCIEIIFNLDLNYDTFLELCFDENCQENEKTVKKFCADILLDKF
jgi:hypothetical protein